MYNLKKKIISVKEISKFLNINYTGKNFKISSISSLNNIKNNSILFYSDIVNTKELGRYSILLFLIKLSRSREELYIHL